MKYKKLLNCDSIITARIYSRQELHIEISGVKNNLFSENSINFFAIRNFIFYQVLMRAGIFDAFEEH